MHSVLRFFGVEDKDFTLNENVNIEKSSILHSHNPQPQVNVNTNVEDTTDLLCLSPSRLIIAFGILLVILLLIGGSQITL